MSLHLSCSAATIWGAGFCLLVSSAGCGGGSGLAPQPIPAVNSIAFVSTRDGAPEIYRMNPDGSEQTVPEKGGRVGNNGIQLKDVATGKATEPDFSLAGASHFRFDNGTKVIYSVTAFLSPSGARFLSIYDFATQQDTQGPQAQSSPASKDRAPDYSPDGQSIVWDAIVEGKSNQIYRANADGGGVAALTSQGENYSPDW